MSALPVSAATRRFMPERLFRPERIVVVTPATPIGRRVTANLVQSGYRGALWHATPEAVGRLPGVPDLALLCGAEPPEATLRALATLGCFAAIALDVPPDLRAAAIGSGVRVLGPGSFGLAVPGLALDASAGHIPPRAGKLALVSQSAALCRAVLDWSGPNGVGFSHIVGIGGNADFGFAGTLDWLSRDPGTGAILLDIRRIKDPRAFLSAARAAARLRPVMALRAGGRWADPSGDADLVMEAALRRAGVLTVENLDDLLAAAETLTRARPTRGDRLAIVTNAIGPGLLAADSAIRHGLSLLDTAEILPGTVAAPRGLIYAGPHDPGRLAGAVAAVSALPEAGGVLVVHAPTGPDDDAAMAALAARRPQAKLPMLVCAMGETTAAAYREMLADAGVPAFATPEQAVRGFLHLVKDRRARAAARELPASVVLSVAPDRAEVRRIIRRARGELRSTLAQDEALGVLEAYGVPIVPSRRAWGADGAAEAARLLGFPVVLKLLRTERWQGARRGGLALDLHDEAETLAAARVLDARQTRARGQVAEREAPLLVQRQVGRARELLLRVRDDAMFGATIGFGQGGTTADILHDLAIDLPPLNLSLAHALIARTRIATALGTERELPAADIDAIAETLVRISQLIVDTPEIAELDVNPLFADADGVAAADAWIRLRPLGDVASRLAIAPYPAELRTTWAPRSGGPPLVIRPIRPEDATAHAAMFARLTPEDIRYRFFTAMRELSPEQIARMTQVDYDREMAFVAVRPPARDDGPDETMGVARLVCDTDMASAEFAILVEPAMKGQGLARALMARLIDWGRARGVRRIVGQVLADNAPMLAFVHRLGFAVHRMRGEEDVMEVTLPLEAEAAPA